MINNPIQNSTDKQLCLFASCVLVKGSKRSLICDLQRNNEYHFVPNDLFDIIELTNKLTISEIINLYEDENKNTIWEYFNFLLNNELAFICDKMELDLFPRMKMDWDSSATITNAIIDNPHNGSHNYELIFNQLIELNCQDIQIRFFTELPIDFFDRILSNSLNKPIKSIELVVKNNTAFKEEDLIRIGKKYFNLKSIIVHSCDENRSVYKDNTGMGDVIYIKDVIGSSSYCGIIHPSYFISSISLFSESQKHNTCLNRKISIDINGEIKNCPSMTKSYGNITKTTLKEAIEKPGFKDLWFINKDKIEVCKDCEFRHICTDCRAYIEKPEDIYSKPLKCGYNPYTATWEEWSTNPLKQKAIEYYCMQELVKPSKKSNS